MRKLINKILPLIVVLLFFSTFSLVYAQENTFQLSFTDGKSFHPQLAVVDNTIYAVWTDDSVGNKETFFSKSNDGGNTFDAPINLSKNNGTSSFPRMEVVNGKIFVTWYDYSLGKSEIFLSKSIDGGNSFDTKVISNNDGASYNPWIKTDGTNVFVVWNDETPHMEGINIQGPENVDVVLGDLDILFANSHDNGETFETINLSNSKDAVSYDPRITISGKNVYVVWNETIETGDEIFFSMSTDSGKTFSEPKNISKSVGSSKGSGIQVSGNNIYIIWNELGDIFFSSSEDHGESFSDPIRISHKGGGSMISRDTQLIVDGENIMVVFYNNSVNKGVFVAKSNDRGKTFGIPILVADFTSSLDAQIAASGDNIHIIANQVSDESHIFLRSSNNGGLSFDSLQKISKGHPDSRLSALGPQIVSHGDRVFVTYESRQNETSNLLLSIFNKTHAEEGILLLQTEDKTIDVLVDFGEELPNIENITEFELKFLEHQTGMPIENVTYSFEIIDDKGNTIFSKKNQVAKGSSDIQKLQFPKSGTATINIEIIGAGIHEQIKLNQGKTSAVITVVPEFPSSVLGVLVLVVAGIIVLARLHGISSRKLSKSYSYH